MNGWGRACLRDLFRVRRGGELLLHDAIRIDGEIDAKLAHTAIGAGARVVATIVYVAPDTAAKLDRAAVVGADGGIAPDVEAAASAWNGMLVARILGPDSAAVRRAVIAALAMLREDRPLPRVWLC